MTSSKSVLARLTWQVAMWEVERIRFREPGTVIGHDCDRVISVRMRPDWPMSRHGGGAELTLAEAQELGLALLEACAREPVLDPPYKEQSFVEGGT